MEDFAHAENATMIAVASAALAPVVAVTGLVVAAVATVFATAQHKKGSRLTCEVATNVIAQHER